MSTRIQVLFFFPLWTHVILLSVRARLAQFHSTRLLEGVCVLSSSCFMLKRPTPAQTIKVPQMAESISEGTLKSWSKKEGDVVAADEEVATIETDKVLFLFPLSLNPVPHHPHQITHNRSTFRSTLLSLVRSSSFSQAKKTP